MKSRVMQSKGAIYGLVGRDIPYSLSPMIFRRAFDELGWQSVYGIFDLKPAHLHRFVAAAAHCGIAGFNVTQPYKLRIMPHLDRIDRSARAVGAVNTVVRQGHGWTGFNTDVVGVHQALSAYQRDLMGANIVIIGAGGAARAVAYALATRLKASRVTFAVRSHSKGQSVARQLSVQSPHSCHWNACQLTRDALQESLTDASLLVNATPVGGFGSTGRSPIPHGVRLPRTLAVFDLIYNPGQTKLLRDAKAAGCRRLCNGWGMLVAQAEESFFLWTGMRFPSRIRTELLRMEKEL